MPSPNPLLRREHAGAAVVTVLDASMDDNDLSFTIVANSGWPTGAVGNFYVVVDPGNASEEKILCTTRSGVTVNVHGTGRGVDGTTAKTHAKDAVVRPCWTAVEADQANEHAASASGVHNVTGAVVGTTDTQVLTGKTISGADNTITNIAQANVTNLVADLAAAGAGKQPLDATLTALAALSATAGFLAQTAADTFTKRTLTAANSMVTISGGDGTAVPTIGVAPANFTGIPIAGVTGLQAALDAKARYPVVKNKTADESLSSSSTMQNDNELFITLPVGVWRVEMQLRAATAVGGQGGDIKTDWTNTGTMSVAGARQCFGPQDSNPESDLIKSYSTLSITQDITYNLDSSHLAITETFILSVTVAGDLQLRWAQDSSHGDQITVTAGSWILAMPVA